MRVNGQTVELTEGESVIVEGYRRLLVRGYPPEDAVKIILGVDIIPMYRPPAEVTDNLLVGPFLEYLLLS
jgi:hypothetical protein